MKDTCSKCKSTTDVVIAHHDDDDQGKYMCETCCRENGYCPQCGKEAMLDDLNDEYCETCNEYLKSLPHDRFEPQLHDLKILPVHFKNISTGIKTFEIRYNDRDFKTGDILKLREWDQYRKYSGHVIHAEVLFVLQGGQFGLQTDHVAMSIQILDDEDLTRSNLENNSPNEVLFAVMDKYTGKFIERVTSTGRIHLRENPFLANYFFQRHFAEKWLSRQPIKHSEYEVRPFEKVITL